MTTHKRTLAFTIALGAFTAVCGYAQRPSPAAETSITLSGKKITIKYSAPSMRGRKIFGGLLENGSVWRTGANEATSLVTETNLEVGGLKVPAGGYTIFTLLDPAAWQLIINKQTGQSGTEYDQANDLGRVKMTMSHPASPIETFKITLASDGAKSGTLTLAWENTVATVPIHVE